MDLLSPEEKFILDTLRPVAKLTGNTTAHREYQRRALYARKMAAKGDTKAAEKEYEVMRKKFPQLWKFGKLLLRVYQEGFHADIGGISRPKYYCARMEVNFSSFPKVSCSLLA